VLRDLPDDDEWIRAQSQVIGARIQARRVQMDATQEAVYLAARVDRRTLQALEGGRGNPRLSTLMRLARVLGMSLDELVGERPPPTGDEGGRASPATGPIGGDR
jgi:transcriptional regulator with XRE-family HTH domain